MEYQIRTITISRSWYIQLWPSGHLKSNSVPFIRMQGLWLRDLGFNEGDKITIWTRNGELIITPEREYEFK